jgi:hypothetical protein
VQYQPRNNAHFKGVAMLSQFHVRRLLPLAAISLALAGPTFGQVISKQNSPVALKNEMKVGSIRLLYARPIRKALKKPVMTDLSKPDVDLTPSITNFKLKIRDQAGRDTCSVHALTFLIEFEYARQNLNLVTSDLSEEYLNYTTNLASGSTDDGDYFFNINKGYQKFGHSMQTQVPNKTSFDPNFKVDATLLEAGAKNWPKLKASIIKENANFTSSTADDAQPFGLSTAQFNQLISNLDQNRPVAVGMRWPSATKYDTETILGVELLKNLPPADLTGGHSIALVGYRKLAGYPGGGYFIIRNSWGTDYGNQGYGYISFAYIRAHSADAMTYQ